ncbi:MAG TPA: YceI family protein [Pyrinomonadaceae bacterium]|nr:YceI family protein [Acidobacteriota bacterium]HQZ94921.1 YceI family protein [Pyrinomonadaceae bacterium]
MKRTSLLLGIAFLAFVALSQSGVGAVNKTFSERFAGGPAIGDSGVYNFDKAHSFIGFKVKHSGLIEVPGFFRDFTGTVNFDAKDISKSTVEFTAKATSVDTGVAGRDNHLRTKDFFEVETYPDITFKSTKVEKKGKAWMVTGDFTMKGVTKSITFPFEISGWLAPDERSGGKMGITAETELNRREYGVNYPNTVVSDQIKIVLQIEAGKKK